MNERRLSLLLRSVEDYALAAIFVLRAHAAKKVNSQFGLEADMHSERTLPPYTLLTYTPTA